MNKDKWEELSKIAETFKKKTREEWTNIFDGTDACVAPILNLSEAPNHPHLKSRNTFLEVDNYMQPAPAPRFSNPKRRYKNSPQTVGQNNDEVCQKYNLDINHFKKKINRILVCIVPISIMSSFLNLLISLTICGKYCGRLILFFGLLAKFLVINMDSLFQPSTY
ncbi:MAG: hypothetical protein CM15mP127_11220 [Gammaproteobacteria bacterium]|nr:MAG: hypothetical protein CM15mP127_11220 [Gammaproteobacteria bacterium]